MNHLPDLLIVTLIVLAIGVLLWLVIIPLDTVVHEAGHALVLAALTKDKIVVFLGSYGEEHKSIRLNIGRFQVWLRKNPLRWRGGLCISNNTGLDEIKQMMVVLGGPITSLLLCLLILGYFIIRQPEGMLAPFLALSCIYTGYSFLANIIPRDKAIVLANGHLTYNDGTKIQQLRTQRKMPPEYAMLQQHYLDGRYELAMEAVDALIAAKVYSPDIYRIGVMAGIQQKNYRQAAYLQAEQIKRFGRLNTHDRINKSALMIHLERPEKAIGYLKHLLELYGPDKHNFNNLGYVLTLAGEYEASLPYLTSAIKIDPQFAYPFSNRAFALLQLGRLEEGKQDNDASLKLDAGNGHAFRNEGIYWLKKHQYSEALAAFEKAEALEEDLAGIQGYIQDAKAGMRPA